MTKKQTIECNRCGAVEDIDSNESRDLWIQLDLKYWPEHKSPIPYDLCPRCSRGLVDAITGKNPFVVEPEDMEVEEVIHMAVWWAKRTVEANPDMTKEQWRNFDWFKSYADAMSPEHYRFMANTLNEAEFFLSVEMFELIANEIARHVYGQKINCDYVNWDDEEMEKEATRRGYDNDDLSKDEVLPGVRVGDRRKKYSAKLGEIDFVQKPDETSTFVHYRIEDLGFDEGMRLAKEDKDVLVKDVMMRAAAIREIYWEPNIKEKQIAEIRKKLGEKYSDVEITDIRYWYYVDALVESYIENKID